MKVKKRINAFRRKLMHYLTNKIVDVGFSDKEILNTIDVKRVLICRPNHRLGNQLLISPLVQEVINTFPECKIDLLVQGNLAQIIFKNYENVNKIIGLPRKPFKQPFKYIYAWWSIKKQPYDLVINAVRSSSSGKISTQFSNSKHKFFGDFNEDSQSKFKDFNHIAKNSIYSLRDYLNTLGFIENNKEIPLLDLKLSTDEIARGHKILKDLVKNDKKIISIFTYATDDKCYSESWWLNFYKRLKVEYSSYNIIEVLPVENVSQINFKAPSFYSKDIREIGSVIANTEVFIGADSGIMHLASASLTPTVGLFSRANQNEYEPYGNHSIGINTNNSNEKDYIQIINEILHVQSTSLSDIILK